MKKQPIDLGPNRTGGDLKPEDLKELVRATEEFPPTTPGDDSAYALMLGQYAAAADPMGTMPMPATLKGAVKSAVKAMKGQMPTVLLDKLGERLAFEREGTRLYDALIAKLDAVGTYPGGPTREELVHIRDEEAQHFMMVATAIREKGADPTAVTPSANLHAVASMGLAQVLTDPRTTVAECLEALLIAELADNDAWDMLVALCVDSGDTELAERFECARQSEQEHLSNVRGWVKRAVDAKAHMKRAA